MCGRAELSFSTFLHSVQLMQYTTIPDAPAFYKATASYHLRDMNSNRWQQPSNQQQASTPLLVHNTLTNSKVPLVGSGSDPRSLTWYTCGPTVYDSAHLGHAKNYVSGDIIRRVLEDYFGFNILMVMNVTDVEDKIVYRARRNYLLDQYRVQHAGNAAKVCRGCGVGGIDSG